MNKNEGHMHPVTTLVREINSIFEKMGFEFVDGPEMESEYNNFDTLNFPPNHPARDMQDTFWIKDKDRMLLRTHTSSVQVPYMKVHKPPMRIIVPGKVFRNEATDATHEAQFHQVEGFMVGKDITLATLKSVLQEFLDKLLQKDTKIRFRPGFFPFVEPGVEVDALCFKCEGRGCSVCKRSGWIEILGAGMVHPKVLENGGINPRHWQGFAFGIGLERIAMLKYGVEDIRLFYSGDLRFINQF
jgi:phenylalanyl-tRNA synthetase alpha chain